jgi:hypothetical protein
MTSSKAVVPVQKADVAKNGLVVRPNVGGNRPGTAGWLGPVSDNVANGADRAKPACRGGSGSATG